MRVRALCVGAAALLAACGAACGQADSAAGAVRMGVAEAPAKAPGAIRLATYNLLNLFDDRDDPSLSGENEDIDDAKPEAERAAVAAAIRRLDADVLALQEIESYDALIEFREKHLRGLGYDHVVSIDVGSERGIEQAALSRFPIIEAQVWPTIRLGGVHPELWQGRPNRYAGQPLESRRSPLRVVVEVPGERAGGEPYRLTLFVVHQKSGRGNEYWREAESARFIEMISEAQSRDPGANIALLGDFNAQPTDQSVKAYVSAGMTDVFAGAAAEAPMTHESDRRIDMILVNAGLARELAPGSAFVLGTPLRPSGADYRTTPAPAGFASDHLPVAVDLVPRDR